MYKQTHYFSMTDLSVTVGVSGHRSTQSHDWHWVFLYSAIRPSSFTLTLPAPALSDSGTSLTR